MLLILFSILFLISCFNPFHDKIKGHAVIVDNFTDKNPLEGVYIEVEQTEDEGYNYYVIGSAITDENGRFFLYCTNDVQRVHALAEGRPRSHPLNQQLIIDRY